MIAGEKIGIEITNTDPYDSFLSFKKKKKRSKKRKQKKPLSEEEIAAKREKRQQIWSGLGDSFKQGGVVNSIFGLFSQNREEYPEQNPQKDYSIHIDRQADKTREGGKEKEDGEKKLPKGLMILGGLLLVAGGYYLYTQNQQSKNQGPI